MPNVVQFPKRRLPQRTLPKIQLPRPPRPPGPEPTDSDWERWFVQADQEGEP